MLSVSGCNKEAKEEKKQFDILTQDILDLLDDSFKLETAMLYQGVIYREVLYMTPTRIHSADIINEEEFCNIIATKEAVIVKFFQ